MNKNCEATPDFFGHGGHYLEGFDHTTCHKETNRGLCACDVRYEVSDQYHWHDAGICHNREECRSIVDPTMLQEIADTFSDDERFTEREPEQDEQTGWISE